MSGENIVANIFDARARERYINRKREKRRAVYIEKAKRGS